jgi:hypothetical protein
VIYTNVVHVNPTPGWRNYIEGEANIEMEDGGAAMIVNFPANDDGVFVRVQSYQGTDEHHLLDQLVGKTVRVTVEVVK